MEALVGTLEDSFSVSEHILAGSPAIASPRALASLKAEKGRRQQLLGRLTRVRPAPPSLPAIARARVRVRCGRCVLTVRGVQLAASLPNNSSAGDEVGGQSAANEDAHVMPEEKLGSEEWKHTTLVRLRKFLRRQYRERKNKALESMSTTGESEETSSDERAQLQQLAADIKSIEFEIRLLSGSKTVVQHGKRSGGHGDSARSQRDTVQRLLGSAGSGERLQKLLESDERDAGGETAAGDELSAVRRNLLDYYADPVPGESIPDASTPFDDASRAPAAVDGCIEAIKDGGAMADESKATATLPRAVSQLPAHEEERETNSSPCKIARLHRKMAMENARPPWGAGAKPLQSREGWSDVDLARWAAVNADSTFPSPVHMVPPVPSINGLCITNERQTLGFTSEQHVGVGSREQLALSTAVENTSKQAEVRALAAKKFSVLEDRGAASKRALAGDCAAVCVAVGETLEESSLAAGHTGADNTMGSCVTTAHDDAVLRTIRKILSGPGSTPDGNMRNAAARTDTENLDELSMECLAALRSSAHSNGEEEGEVDCSVPPTCGDTCGQVQQKSHEESDRLLADDVSDVLLQSVDASESLAAAGLEDLEDASLLEGTSLLQDFEPLPVDRSSESIALFPYVFAATPTGQPSVPVRKVLAPEFDQARGKMVRHAHAESHAGSQVAASLPLDSTPTGEPSMPVAKSLMQMFDQCLSPELRAQANVALIACSSPGQAAQAESSNGNPLRSVVKRLAFASESPEAKRPALSAATLLADSPGDLEASSTAPAAVKQERQVKTLQQAPSLATTGPNAGALSRLAKGALASRPSSAMSRLSAAPSAARVVGGAVTGATRAAPSSKVAWAAPKDDNDRQPPGPLASGKAQTKAMAGSAASAASLQASNQKKTTRPLSAPLLRGVVSHNRAAVSVSPPPHRTLFSSAGLAAAKDAMLSELPSRGSPARAAHVTSPYLARSLFASMCVCVCVCVCACLRVSARVCVCVSLSFFLSPS